MAMRILLLLAVVSSSLAAQVGLSRRMADQLYKAGENHRALEVYNRLLRDNPNDPELNYNAGNALYRLEKYADARKYYERALSQTSNESLKNNIRYNLANCDFKEKKLQESIDKYKQVLRDNSGDEDARKNLEFALQQLNQPPPPPAKGDKSEQSQGKGKKSESQEDRSGNSDEKQQKKKEDSENKSEQRPLKFSKEEAERLLDALKDQEKDYQQRKLRDKVSASESSDKDW